MKRQQKTCGGRRGAHRLRQGHRFRLREPKAPPLPPAPRLTGVLLEDLARSLDVLAQLPPPWDPDIDDPVREPVGGPVVDGFWTGKIYTARRGSWCTYLEGSVLGGPTSAAIVIALCRVRNALPELIRLAAIGTAFEAAGGSR